MGTYTTNYNLYTPTVGETGWGTLVNGNFSTIDTTMKSLSNRITTCESYGARITAIENEVNGALSCTSVTASGKITGNGGIAGTTGTFSGNVTAPFFNGTPSGCTLYIIPYAQNVSATFKPHLSSGSIYGTGDTPWMDVRHEASIEFPTAGTYTFDVTPRFVVNGFHITKIVNNTSATLVLAGDENKANYYFTWNGLTIAKDNTPSRTIAQINSILQTGMPNTKLVFTKGYSGDDFLPHIRIKNTTGGYLSYYIY